MMIKVKTIREQVYDIIRLRVANGTYPHGFHLQEISLAKELNVSRSPVREALHQLVAEELLDATVNKGIRVREFSEREIHEIFDFRIVIETAALDYLRVHPEAIPYKDLERVKNNVLQLTPQHIDYVIAEDTNPHYLLVGAMGNAYITRRHLQASYCTMSFHSILFSNAMYNESINSHLALIDHIMDRNFQAGQDTLYAHLIASRDYICTGIRNMAKNQTD